MPSVSIRTGLLAQHFAQVCRRLSASATHLMRDLPILKSAIQTDQPRTGRISLVGAGPGARDLLTLRAVDRLQRADVIFYDRLVDPEILDLARADAQRIYVGKSVGANAWPQDRINAVVLAAALRGQHVVRLKSGDPSIFGRATEEIGSAQAAGIPVEIVPGLTAACASAASTGRSLTERGDTDHVIFATGTCRPGDPAPDWAEMLRPGATLVLYMAVHKAAEIAASLQASDMRGLSDVCIVSKASCLDETRHTCPVNELADYVVNSKIENPAVLIIRRSKHATDDTGQTKPGAVQPAIRSGQLAPLCA